MTVDMTNGSNAQFGLPETWPPSSSQFHGSISALLAGWSTWQYVVTFLLGVVLYDQGC